MGIKNNLLVMFFYLKNILFIFKSTLSTKYKWLAIFYMIWLYRVEFMPDTGAGVAKVLQVVTLLAMTCLLSTYCRSFVSNGFAKTNAPIVSALTLYVLAMVSTAWAFLPQFAFFIAYQNIFMLLLMVWFFSLFQSFKAKEKAFVYFVVISLIFESVALRLSTQPVFIAHFLPAGSCAAMLFSYCVGEYLGMKKHDVDRKKFLKITMLFSVFMLCINTSGGANSSAVFGFAVALLFSGHVVWATMLGGVAVYIISNQNLMNDIILTLMPDKTLEQIESGNGREAIWEALLAMAHQKPILGWGFACIERTCPDVITGQTLSDAHNNYIGMYGSLGVVGLVIFCIHYVCQVFYSLARRVKIGYVGILSATACGMLNGYSYGYMSGKTCSITVAYLAIVALTSAYSKCRNYD